MSEDRQQQQQQQQRLHRKRTRVLATPVIDISTEAPNDDSEDGCCGCAGSLLSKENCESTVTMHIRCTRWQLIWMALPLAMLLTILLNAYIYHFHHHTWAMTPGTDAKGGSVTREFFQDAPQQRRQRRQRQRQQQQKTRRKQPRRAEPIPPRPASLEPNATFSACLLIKDDNEILNEWIAYHYHVIKMRKLVVAVDPSSSEWPSDILQKWRNMTDLQITEWSDTDYMPTQFLRNHRPPKKYMEPESKFGPDVTPQAYLEINNHRYRQRVFLAQCMKTLRQQKQSWVIHIDTDEFVVASKLLRQMKPQYVTLPPMDEPGSVLTLLQQAVAQTSELVSYPCISMLRVLFGSVESAPEQQAYQVPQMYNPPSLETMRWRHHALPHNMSFHGNPKVILDVSAIPDSAMPEVVFSIHRPVTDYCHRNDELSFASFRKQPIGVNHYLGSWERYSARKDKRRSRQVYNAKATVSRGKDDGVRLWLEGFTKSIGGTRVAAQLLGRNYIRPEYAEQLFDNHTMDTVVQ